jgi:hypothetical protein
MSEARRPPKMTLKFPGYDILNSSKNSIFRKNVCIHLNHWDNIEWTFPGGDLTFRLSELDVISSRENALAYGMLYRGYKVFFAADVDDEFLIISTIAIKKNKCCSKCGEYQYSSCTFSKGKIISCSECQ